MIQGVSSLLLLGHSHVSTSHPHHHDRHHHHPHQGVWSLLLHGDAHVPTCPRPQRLLLRVHAGKGFHEIDGSDGIGRFVSLIILADLISATYDPNRQYWERLIYLA